MDAGVIEEARARQRRRRRAAAATAVVAAGAIAAALLVSSGGPANSTPGSAGSAARGSRPPVAAAKCVLPRPPSPTTQTAPNHALLALLGVLRRPQRASDALPPSIRGQYNEEIFVNYVRRVRVVDRTAYYVIPVLVTTCEPGPAYEAVRFVAAAPDGTSSGGQAPIAAIANGTLAGASGAGGPSSTFASIVPDGVASVTLHYPADPPTSPHPLTVTATVANNCVVAAVARNAAASPAVIWHAKNGAVIPH